MHKIEEKSLGRCMAMTLKSMRHMLRRNFSQHGIHLPLEQYFILKFIQHYPGGTQQELSNMMDKDKSAVQRLINKLESKDYVVRLQDDEDKRRNHLRLTSKGEKFLVKAVDAEKTTSNQLTSGISGEDIQTFIRVLYQIRENENIVKE